MLADAGVDIELLPRPTDVPDVDETGDTLEENARLKAEALCVGDRAARPSPTTPVSRSTPSAVRPGCARPASPGRTPPTPTT